MKASAGALLASGIWPGALQAQDAAAPDFTFIEVNDLHYFDQGCLPFFQKMLDMMKEVKDASLLLVVGDTCEHGTASELGGIKEILMTTKLPIKVVIGNHDWTTQTDRKLYDQTWSDSINYTFDHHGWQFVGLDSSNGLVYENTSIQQPTLDWVDQTLPTLDKKKPMILFTHFPLGQGVKYQPKNSDALLERFKAHNLRAVFNGHFHSSTERGVGDYLITTNRCCAFRRDNHDGTKEKGFLVCRTKDGKVTREFMQVA